MMDLHTNYMIKSRELGGGEGRQKQKISAALSNKNRRENVDQARDLEK